MLVATIELIVWLPEVALVPDQLPEAVQLVAFVEDQLTTDDPPLVTDAGFAEIDTAGAVGGVPVTLTWTEALALPSGPVQVSEKVLLVVSGGVAWVPEVALVPDHAPPAVHDTAFVELHVSVAAPPLATDVGLAARDADGPADDSLSPPPPQAASASAGTSRRALVRSARKLT